MARAIGRLSVGHGHLIAGSAWLVAATATAALGGFGFWLVAAHVDSASTIGRASALFTSSQFLNYATGMGLPIAVARYAHDRSLSSRVLVQWALVYTTLTSFLGAGVFFGLAPHSLAAPLLGAGFTPGFLLFSSIVTGMSFTLIVDMRLMALRKWRWVFGRALCVTLVRMPFLLLHPFRSDVVWLLVLVGGTQAASGLVGAAVLEGWSWRDFVPLPPRAGRALRYASVNYLGQLAIQAPFFVVPVIVLLRVRPSANAVFYVAWSAMAVVLLSVQMISQALLAEGGKDGARLSVQVRVTLFLAVGFAAVSFVLSYFGAAAITTLYGHAYAHAAHLLPILVLATVPWAVTATYLSEARVREGAKSIVAISVVYALLILVPAGFISGHAAADQAARAWLFGNTAAAAVSIAVAIWARRRGLRRARRRAPFEPTITNAAFGLSAPEFESSQAPLPAPEPRA